MNNPTDLHKHTNSDGKVLILKCIRKDRTSFRGFKYPAIGKSVEPEKWDASPTCGNGLHGWPWGVGIGHGYTPNAIDDLWIILEAHPDDVVGPLDYSVKCKCRIATIIDEGSLAYCLDKLSSGVVSYANKNLKYSSRGNGYGSYLDMGKHESIHSPAVFTIHHNWTYAGSRNGESITVSNTGGSPRVVSCGDDVHITSTADCANIAANGFETNVISTGKYACVVCTGSNSDVLSLGTGGIAISLGRFSTIAAGEDGIIVGRYRDDRGKARIAVGYVGENGILPNTRYYVDVDGTFHVSTQT